MDPIWLKSYPADVPHHLVIPKDQTVVSLFQTACSQNPDETAFTCLGESLSFDKLYDYSVALATYFQQTLGIRLGDRVAIMLPNILQYPVALFAIQMIGGVVVNLNPMDKAAAIRHELVDSGARAIVVLENFVVELQQVVAETAIEKVILTSVGELFSPVKGWLVNSYLRHVKQVVPEWKMPGAIRFHRALALGQASQLVPVMVTQADLAFLQYTGGTTGKAKGVELSHGNMVSNLYQARAWLLPSITGVAHPVIVTALPLYHIFSLMANCLLFLWLGGHNILIPDPRDIRGFIKTLRKQPFHGITGVNTLFNALNQQAAFAKVDFAPLKIALGGGMSIQQSVADKWYEITGCPITQAYGLTEASPAVCINVFDNPFDGFVGPPLPETQVKLIDEHGRKIALGESGELCIKGPQVMQGYWQNPEATQEAFVKGWLKTGDIAQMDERGFIKLVDRKKDVIIVSGFNVFPAEVEAIIMQLPEVIEVGVVGVPSEVHGEIIKAFVVKQADSTLTQGDVIAHCHHAMAAYKSPKLVEFVDTLPKSLVGKVLRRELRH